MNHLEYALVIIVISLSMIGIAVFRLRPKALEGNGKSTSRFWKPLLLLSLLLFAVGILILFLPPELWWPGT
jgi:cell division protein FtsW (lipid II flippase)